MRASIHRHDRKEIAGTPAAAEPARPVMALQTAQAAPLHDISGVPIDVAQRKQAGGDNAKAYRAPNRTGLPDRLKAGVEARSGLSLDRVRVHTNSDQPAQLNAHAFTRGTDIHVAPGQERHLPHEAWHVAQQAQGRVRPTISVAGESVNDDAALEREADTLGAASAAHGAKVFSDGAPNLPTPGPTAMAGAAVQRVIEITDGSLEGKYDKPHAHATTELVKKVDEQIGGELRLGWKGEVRQWVEDKTNTYSYDTTDSFLEELKETFKKEADTQVRPNFPTSTIDLAETTYELDTGKSRSTLYPQRQNLAIPHLQGDQGEHQSVHLA
jgi:hypothetical protein